MMSPQPLGEEEEALSSKKPLVGTRKQILNLSSSCRRTTYTLAAHYLREAFAACDILRATSAMQEVPLLLRQPLPPPMPLFLST